MRLEQNKALLTNARNLRKGMTKEERKLWYTFLCKLPVRFRRQQIVGNYIVDFYCHSKGLVIELDGSQHYEDQGKRTDQERDAYLRSLGLCVLRYANSDVNRNFRGVCEDILNHLEDGGPLPSSALRETADDTSPGGGGKAPTAPAGHLPRRGRQGPYRPCGAPPPEGEARREAASLLPPPGEVAEGR